MASGATPQGFATLIISSNYLKVTIIIIGGDIILVDWAHTCSTFGRVLISDLKLFPNITLNTVNYALHISTYCCACKCIAGGMRYVYFV